MSDLERHSVEIDCRGAGYKSHLTTVNKVLVTKTYPSDSLVPVATEVSCSHLQREKKECTIGGMSCPHLSPVSSAS